MTYWALYGYHQFGRGKLLNVGADEAFRRLLQATNTRDERRLAEWLGVKQACIFDAKRRNIMPIQWLRELVLKRSDYSPSWVLTGYGPQLWSEYWQTPAGRRILQLEYLSVRRDDEGESA